MFKSEVCRLREEVKEQKELIDDLLQIIGELRAEIKRNDKLCESLEKIADNSKYRHQLLKKNGKLYILMRCHEEVDRYRQKYEFRLHLYDISRNARACRAEVTVYHDVGEVKIASLDTEELYQRNGLGSFVLSYLVHYCKISLRNKLYAKMYAGSPITYDGVRSFYKKNGFEVTDSGYAVMQFGADEVEK